MLRPIDLGHDRGGLLRCDQFSRRCGWRLLQHHVRARPVPLDQADDGPRARADRTTSLSALWMGEIGAAGRIDLIGTEALQHLDPVAQKGFLDLNRVVWTPEMAEQDFDPTRNPAPYLALLREREIAEALRCLRLDRRSCHGCPL